MEVDGLPIWAKVGDLDISEEKLRELESHGTHHDVMPEHSFIYTHRHFSFGFNGDRIVEVNMTASDPQLVEADKSFFAPLTSRPLIFSVSSSWSPSTGSYARRFDRYLESSFFESQIHWFSVLNIFMIVVFLAGLVALIMMRTLSLDYSRYTQAVDGDDTGWKRIHGDVFRPCPHWPLFAVLMGTGAHIVATVVLSLLLILLITRYVGRTSPREFPSRRLGDSPRRDRLFRHVFRQRIRLGSCVPTGLLPAGIARLAARRLHLRGTRTLFPPFPRFMDSHRTGGLLRSLRHRRRPPQHPLVPAENPRSPIGSLPLRRSSPPVGGNRPRS